MAHAQHTEYSKRLESFNDWKGADISKEKYAASGFFAMDPKKFHIFHYVSCEACRLTTEPRDIDDPDQLHITFAPYCKYAPQPKPIVNTQSESENVTLKTEQKSPNLRRRRPRKQTLIPRDDL